MEHNPGIAQLNRLSDAELAEALLRCCGSSKWVRDVCASRPFASEEALYNASDKAWQSAGVADWLEAFLHHPRIGDVDSLRKKFAATAVWASSEQGAVSTAGEATLIELSNGNTEYEKKFGFIFIVCATGKSAAEMLAILQKRLPNDRDIELAIAAGEQDKITRIRLEKLLQSFQEVGA